MSLCGYLYVCVCACVHNSLQTHHFIVISEAADSYFCVMNELFSNKMHDMCVAVMLVHAPGVMEVTVSTVTEGKINMDVRLRM